MVASDTETREDSHARRMAARSFPTGSQNSTVVYPRAATLAIRSGNGSSGKRGSMPYTDRKGSRHGILLGQGWPRPDPYPRCEGRSVRSIASTRELRALL